MLIPLSSIAVIHRQRKAMDTRKVESLAASIEANGLFHPIIVRAPFESELAEAAGRPYVLSMGGRRVAAHYFLGRTEIEANLKESLDPIRAEICELDENIQREDITWQEELEARARIVELQRLLTPGATLTELAEEVGVSVAQLHKDLTLHAETKRDPTLKAATSKGSAIRTAQFKQDIKERVARISVDNTGDLRQKLFTADGRDFIRSVPTASIDLGFSDLPYGIGYFLGRKDANETTKGFYDDSQQTTKDFIVDIVPEFFRVVKPTGWIVFFMCYELHGWLQDLCRDVCLIHHAYRDENLNRKASYCTMSAGGDPCIFAIPEMPPWIWTRRGKGNFGHWPELHAANRYEMLVVVNAGQAKLAKKPVENVLDFPAITEDRLHEMQKPHDLCCEIISRTTVVGERVLDICFGSGAHMAAAANLGRNFLGCDNNPDNLNSALSLVGQYYSRETAAAIEKGRLKIVED